MELASQIRADLKKILQSHSDDVTFNEKLLDSLETYVFKAISFYSR